MPTLVLGFEFWKWKTNEFYFKTPGGNILVEESTGQTAFRGIIFDLDGTLLDTLEDIAGAANWSLGLHGFPGHRLEAYRQFVGKGVRALMARALPHDGRNDETISSCVRSFRDHYKHHWHEHTRRYEGIEQLLDSLTAMNISIAVLSNKPHDFTRACVDTFLTQWSLDPVLGQTDGLPTKPDPAGARQIIDHFGVAPSQVLFLGDSGVDMATAVNAGVYPVGVLWGYRSAEELSGSGARILIGTPTDLLAYL